MIIYVGISFQNIIPPKVIANQIERKILKETRKIGKQGFSFHAEVLLIAARNKATE